MAGDRLAERSTTSRASAPAWARRRRFTAFDGVGLAALAAFALTLAADLAPLGRPRGEISLELDAEALAAGFREGVEWHGLYRGGDKVGFLRLERRRHGDGYRLEQLTVLRGATADLDTELHVQTDLDAAFTLVAFVASTRAPVQARVAGRWVEGALELDVEGIPGQGTRRIPLPEPPAFDFSLAPLAARSDLQPGDRFTFTHFDPMTLASREGVVQMLDREAIDVLGERVEALHLRQEIAGQTLELWINALGEVLREEMPTGLVAVREAEAEATWEAR